MTTEEAIAKCHQYAALKSEGRTDDEIWLQVFVGLTLDEIMQVAEAAIDLYVKQTNNPRMLYHILKEYIPDE
ncbi:MAG TPA: hypothetical protein VH593_20325 [Ktedonobacteraceae bacterium]